MTCQHRSIRTATPGNTDNCILCDLPIMFDGERWVWLHALDRRTRRKLATAYHVDLITGAKQ